MTQFDQQLLTTLFLSEGPQIRDNAAVRAITRVATMFVLIAGSALLAVAAADRLDASMDQAGVGIRSIGPSPEYLNAMATIEAADRAAQPAVRTTEASAR